MQKIKNIEALRFIFAMVIVYYHILHDNLFKLYEDFIPLQNFRSSCNDAHYIVELFFIIAGFFLYKTYEKYKDSSIFVLGLNKFFRLWPVLAFSILCCYILHLCNFIGFNGYREFLDLLLMQNNGISKTYGGINWFVSSLFWAFIFYFILLKNCSRNFANSIIAVITYFSYVGLVHLGFGREVVNDFLSLGVLRGVAGLGLGYLLALFIENLSKIKINIKTPKILTYIIASTVEIYCLGFLLYNFTAHRMSYRNPMIFVFVFSILLILFVQKKGLLSNLFDNNISAFLGKYSYSIYVMQQVTFFVMQNSIWKNESFVLNHINVCLVCSIIISILVGVITYYLIEKPCINFYRNGVETNGGKGLDTGGVIPLYRLALKFVS